SLSVYEAKRKEQQASHKQSQDENPDSRLVLNPIEYEFVNSDPAAFKRKYHGRTRFTEAQFKEFSDDMRSYFTGSAKVKHLPFSIRLDSNGLYVPYQDERSQFFEWLKNELIFIVSGQTIDHSWHIEKLLHGSAHRFSIFYPIHRSYRENDADAEFMISITGPNYVDELDIQIFSYGQLNLDAITRNIESGLRQLRATVARTRFGGNALVIMLAFAGGLSFEWEELLPHISWLLWQNEVLNAIAILDRVPKGNSPNRRQESAEYLLNWISSNFTQPWETRFVVVHNTWHLNQHRDGVEQAFFYHKNSHINSDTIEIPQLWLSDE
ncbi:MAG: hypothetical protein GY805_21225, partial [Chloroflexi bacterium]|nr:hypothetical protein [Chloroflexota bacterium]